MNTSINQAALTAQLAKQSLEIQLSRPKRKKEALLKPASSGNLEKVLVVGGGLTVVYTFWATMPIAAGAAIIAMGLHFSKEVQTFQSPERSESLRLLWESKTVAHPSLLEAFKQQKLSKVYPTDAINQAVAEMADECDWFVFQPTDNHPLANFGEIYCWQDPFDRQVMMPVEGLHKKMRQWGFVESVPTQAMPIQAAIAPVVEPVKPIIEAAPEPLTDTVQPTVAQPLEVPLEEKAWTKPEQLAYQICKGAMSGEMPEIAPIQEPTPTTLVEVDLSSFQQLEPPKMLLSDYVAAQGLKHIIVCSQTRAGKGVWLMQYTKQLKALNPNLKLIAFDGKGDPLEKPRWEHFDVYQIPSKPTHVQQALGKLKSFLDQRRDPKTVRVPIVAVFDEAQNLFDEDCKDSLRSLLSTAAGFNIFLVFVTNNSNVNALGIDGQDRGSMLTVTLGAKGHDSNMQSNLGNRYLFPGEPPVIPTTVPDGFRGYAAVPGCPSILWIPEIHDPAIAPVVEGGDPDLSGFGETNVVQFAKPKQVNLDPEFKTEDRNEDRSEKTYLPIKVSKAIALECVANLTAEGASQTKIIKELWNAVPGGSAAYQQAKAELAELTKELDAIAVKA